MAQTGQHASLARQALSPFRSLGLLRKLNAHGMALALAVATAGVFLNAFRHGAFGITTGLPTLLCGLVWARLLRPTGEVTQARYRGGWLASIPLAILNGALSGGLSMAADYGANPLERFVAGSLLGATFGVVFWLPGLVLTLGFFGFPIARAKSLADRGLAGEERGERFVAAAAALLSVAGLCLTYAAPLRTRYNPSVLDSFGVEFAYLLGGLGLVVSLVAFIIAWQRDTHRKRFVAEASAGRVPGFRVDRSPDGQVLVRVPAGGQDYRVADLEEELVALDEAGEALKEIEPRQAEQA